jgi:hypothetical protein
MPLRSSSMKPGSPQTAAAMARASTPGGELLGISRWQASI